MIVNDLDVFGIAHASLNDHDRKRLRESVFFLDAANGGGVEAAINPALPHSVSTKTALLEAKSRAAGVIIVFLFT